MLRQISRPEILVARAHHALSCRSLQARCDTYANQSADAYGRWALAGTLWARRGWVGRSLTLPADVVFGTLRLSAHPWAFEGTLYQKMSFPSARIYLGPLGIPQGSSALPPEEQYRLAQRYGDEMASWVRRALVLPWAALKSQDEAQGKKNEAQDNTTLQVTQTSQAPLQKSGWSTVPACLTPCTNYLERWNGGVVDAANDSRCLEPIFQQVALITAYAMLYSACAAACISLAIKASVTLFGALVGVAACLVVRPLGLIRMQRDEQLARQGAEDFQELHFTRGALSNDEISALARRISDERFAFLAKAAKDARARSSVAGEEAFRERDTAVLAAKFRKWLSPSSTVSPEEQKALAYFFSSEEGMLPYVWLSMQTQKNSGTHIAQYLMQRFIECSARRDPDTWRRDLENTV